MKDLKVIFVVLGFIVAILGGPKIIDLFNASQKEQEQEQAAQIIEQDAALQLTESVNNFNKNKSYTPMKSHCS